MTAVNTRRMNSSPIGTSLHENQCFLQCSKWTGGPDRLPRGVSLVLLGYVGAAPGLPINASDLSAYAGFAFPSGESAGVGAGVSQPNETGIRRYPAVPGTAGGHQFVLRHDRVACDRCARAA